MGNRHPDTWKQTAIQVAKAEALKKEVEWIDVELLVRTPQPTTYYTKQAGHNLVIQHTARN